MNYSRLEKAHWRWSVDSSAISVFIFDWWPWSLLHFAASNEASNCAAAAGRLTPQRRGCPFWLLCPCLAPFWTFCLFHSLAALSACYYFLLVATCLNSGDRSRGLRRQALLGSRILIAGVLQQNPTFTQGCALCSLSDVWVSHLASSLYPRVHLPDSYAVQTER